MDIKSLWARSLEILKEEINSINFNMWISPIEPTSYKDNSLTLSVEGPFALEMLQARLMPNLKRAVEESCGVATEILIVNKKSAKTEIHLPSKSTTNPD